MKRFFRSLKSASGIYLERLRLFRPNVRLYLLTVLIIGITMGVYRLLFNFYVLSLGLDESVLGNLITANQATALILALPMGYVVDRWGRKKALIAHSMLLAFSVAMVALWPHIIIFYLANILFGLVQSLSSVAMAPFLMENSGEAERTYLFSFSSGMQMGSVFVGNWLGGYLPSWVANLRMVEATSSSAYGSALQVISLLAVLGFVPLLFIRPVEGRLEARRRDFAPFQYARENPKLLTQLLLPSLIISFGAGLFMPFMNVFYRVAHNQSDQVIGTLFAWGSLAMGVGLMLAPPLADRLGKIRLVLLTQGLSIPFMVLLGFGPFGVSAMAYFVRMALMNMSNPIYQTFVLERVDASARVTVSSLVSMVWNFGRSFSPSVSGWLQVTYGFAPVFGAAILLYLIAIPLYWVFFLRKPPPAPALIKP